MNEMSYKKSEIFIIQLKSAIKLFNETDYVSALTLAGAANELISKMCRLNGIEWIHNFSVEEFEKLKKTKLLGNEKFVIKTLNKTRNELKHHDDIEDNIVKADFYYESEMFILSSIESYKLLFGVYPKDKIITNFYKKFSV